MKLVLFLVFVLSVCSLQIQTEFHGFNPTIAERVKLHLSHIPQDNSPPFVYVSIGETPTTLEIIPKDEITRLPSEGFIIRSKSNLRINGTIFQHCYAIAGQALRDHYPNHPSTSFPLGLNYGAYAILEFLGFGFFHPFHVVTPSTIVENLKEINLVDSPKFEARATHLHTQHPIEMTEYLQGFGLNMSRKEEDWSSQGAKYDQFLEWMVANRQNRLEWFLLWSYDWRDFADSSMRQERLSKIFKRTQEFGIVVGMMTPYVQMQQHAFALIRQSGTIQGEFREMNSRLKWLFDAGLDFISVAMGFSEFTHGNATRMLLYMNESTRFIHENYKQKGIYTSVHVSTNQWLDDYKDPFTGKPPLNYNFLAHYSDQRNGVFPHTVQLYSLDDPAPTYGNSNFSHILKFMFLEAEKRETLFFPETNYWVNYDSNVPLFLPLYAERRLYDLRLISREEVRLNKKIKGQINFSSGFEFGYWIADFITARSAWDPLMNQNADNALFHTLNMFTRTFGSSATQITRVLVDLIKDQKDLLIDGKINGVKPRNIVKRSGIAYLQGWDVWADVPIMLNLPIDTHPHKLLFDTLSRNQSTDVDYEKEIRPLLNEMQVKFNGHAKNLASFLNGVPAYSRRLYEDIVDSAALLGLRASFVSQLFEYAWGVKTRQNREFFETKKKLIEQMLLDALKIAQERGKKFLTPAEDIATWRNNPTVYPFTYLATATTLHFWKRDYEKVIGGFTSPCLMNIINPVDVAIGRGIIQDGARQVRKYFEKTPLAYITECFAAPDENPWTKTRK